MKLGVLFAYSTLFAIAPAMAAVDANSCAAKSRQMPAPEQQAFMKSCLETVGSPANVRELEQERKRAACEQNARNQKHDGATKGNYVAECMNRNEAAAAAAAAGAPQAKPAPQARQAAPATARKNASPSHPSAKSCAQEAARKGLKGDARKQFIKDCKAA